MIVWTGACIKGFKSLGPQWRTEHLNLVDHGVAPSDRYVEKLRVKKNAEVMLSHDSNDTGGDGFGEGDDVGDSQGNVLA